MHEFITLWHGHLLFTDIENSTPLSEEHPEAMKSALAKHDAILKEAVESSNGQIVKTTGDGIHAVFSRAIDAIKEEKETFNPWAKNIIRKFKE